MLSFFNPIDGTTKFEAERWIENANCETQNVTLKTEEIEKKRMFLFWNRGHKKVIFIDRVFDENGKVVFKRKSAYMKTMDSGEDIQFRRVKLKEGEIWVFRHSRKGKNEFIERYDYCGNFLGKRKWESGDYYPDPSKN